jgi:hypothetical protein
MGTVVAIATAPVPELRSTRLSHGAKMWRNSPFHRVAGEAGVVGAAGVETLKSHKIRPFLHCMERFEIIFGLIVKFPS